jgi:hypothetical protein
MYVKSGGKILLATKSAIPRNQTMGRVRETKILRRIYLIINGEDGAP